jgi:hypothetical protein
MIIWGKNMNKKILIGSIIAVTILIGVSFTSVVGYNSVVSDVKASPLFNIRSSRAIDEESEGLSCEYVGKGEVSIIVFPKWDERRELVQNILELIGELDNKEIHKFLLYFERIHEKEKLLTNLKDNYGGFNIDYIEGEKDTLITKEGPCFTLGCTIFPQWVPGCFILFVLLIIFSPIIIPAILILEFLHAIGLTYEKPCPWTGWLFCDLTYDPPSCWCVP